MQKQCRCGQSMQIRLRTLVFKKQNEILNVPIFSCEACGHSEAMPEVRAALKEWISTFEETDEKVTRDFQEVSELSSLLCKVTDEQLSEQPVELIVQERINELLDMLLLAQSLGDFAWLNEVYDRLQQITKVRVSI